MKSKLFALLLCALACANLRAAESIPLDALVHETLEKNPELKFYEAEVAAAKSGRRAAGAWPNPDLTVGGGYKGVRSGGTLVGEGAAWSVSIAQPIEWPGRIALRKAIADREIEVAELGLAQFRAVLRRRALTLGYAALSAQQRAVASREIAARFEILRDVLVQRDPAGVTPQLETGILEGTAFTHQRRATEAVVAARQALAELNQLRGLPAQTALTLAGPLPVLPGPRPLDDLLAGARSNNFDLRLRAAELAKQGFRVDLARRERTPAVTLAPYVSQERAGDRETQAGLSVTIPLPLNSAAKGREEIERARLVQAEASLKAVERDVERRIVEAALQFETKHAALAQWKGDPVAKFRSLAELADRHYRLGAVPIATYLEAQKTFLEVLETVTDTHREALDAWLELETLTGPPPRETK